MENEKSSSNLKNRQIRVFISSTFRDMHAERDHLVTVVFPELRERTEKLGLDFFDVDLRWGVPEKDADGEKANSWKYCRKWIDKVDPFFICILGERYGWEPEPDALDYEEDRIRQAESKQSITEMEIRYAVLDGKRKEQSFFYLRETGVPKPEPDASDDEWKLYREFVDESEDRQNKLKALKERIRGCGRPVCEYSCSWTGNGFDGLEEFGDQILEDLWSAIQEKYPSPLEPETPLDAEQQQMKRFADARLRWFCGRTDELKQLNDFIYSTNPDAPRLAMAAAQAGSGKSALLSKLWGNLQEFHSDDFVFVHFVGATERSADARSLVLRVLNELDRNGFQGLEKSDEQEDAGDLNSLSKKLSERLESYDGERKIILILDALNQLSDGLSLSWLPYRIGPSVRIVVSCINDSVANANSPEVKVFHALENCHSKPEMISLSPLSNAAIRNIVVEYLNEYCKQLDDPQIDIICKMPQAGNPLYLLVMLGELRSLGGNDMNAKVPQLVAEMSDKYPDTISLFDWVLEHLEVFGKEAVRLWCMYLSLGRSGMSSRELSDLLARRVGDSCKKTALRIERGIRRYLQHRGEQLDFFHGQLLDAVRQRYESASNTKKLHGEIGAYFEATANPKGGKAWNGAPRPLGELSYHFVEAENWTTLDAIVSSPDFCAARITTSSPFSLIGDCRYALRVYESIVLTVVERAVSTGLSALLDRPEFSLQTLINRLSWIEPHCPSVQRNIENTRNDLDKQRMWVQALSPYPDMDTRGRIPYQVESVAECLSFNRENIVVLGQDGQVRSLDLAEGPCYERWLSFETFDKVVAILDIASEGRLVWLDTDGILRCERSEYSLSLDQTAQPIAFLPSVGVVAVDRRGDLVAWDPDTGHSAILMQNPPLPIKVLRASGDHLLCVAGARSERVFIVLPGSQKHKCLDFVWQQSAIVDAELSQDGQTLILVCRDRSIHRISGRDGVSLGEPLRYENAQPFGIFGAPLRCAIGRQGSIEYVFLATYDGQLGVWDLCSDEFRRLPDWRSEDWSQLGIFDCISSSGSLVAGSSRHAQVFTHNEPRGIAKQYHAPITACVVTDLKDVVAFSEYEGAVRWFGHGPGLQLKNCIYHHGLTAISPIPGSSDVFLGDNQGCCWRQSSNKGHGEGKIFHLFERPVAAITNCGERDLAAADAAGRVKRVCADGDFEMLLRKEPKWPTTQIALQDACPKATCWSLRETAKKGSFSYLVSLFKRGRHEADVLHEKKRPVAGFIRVPGRDVVCVIGSSVRVMKLGAFNKLVPMFERQIAVRFACVLGDAQWLAVVRWDSLWLEILGLAPGLPEVAAAELSDDITCLAARGDLIVVGFKSGGILKLKLRGPQTQPVLTTNRINT